MRPAAGLLGWALLLGCPGPQPRPPLLLDCEPDAGRAPSTEVLYLEVHRPVCGNCHYNGGRSPLMTSPEAIEALIGVQAELYPPLPYVTPGDLRRSLMYLKVMGGTRAGYTGPGGEDTGDLMPKGGPPLEEAQKDTLRRWICHGAPRRP